MTLKKAFLLLVTIMAIGCLLIAYQLRVDEYFGLSKSHIEINIQGVSEPDKLEIKKPIWVWVPAKQRKRLPDNPNGQKYDTLTLLNNSIRKNIVPDQYGENFFICSYKGKCRELSCSMFKTHAWHKFNIVLDVKEENNSLIINWVLKSRQKEDKKGSDTIKEIAETPYFYNGNCCMCRKNLTLSKDSGKCLLTVSLDTSIYKQEVIYSINSKTALNAMFDIYKDSLLNHPCSDLRIENAVVIDSYTFSEGEFYYRLTTANDSPMVDWHIKGVFISESSNKKIYKTINLKRNIIGGCGG